MPTIPVVYRTPITEKDAQRVLSGRARIYVTLRRGQAPAPRSPGSPVRPGRVPQIAFVLVGAGHRVWPTDWPVRSIMLYTEPEA